MPARLGVSRAKVTGARDSWLNANWKLLTETKEKRWRVAEVLLWKCLLRQWLFAFVFELQIPLDLK